jgi:hypothetical protein
LHQPFGALQSVTKNPLTDLRREKEAPNCGNQPAILAMAGLCPGLIQGNELDRSGLRHGVG